MTNASTARIWTSQQCAPDEAMDVLVDADGNPIDVILLPDDGVAVETFDGPVDASATTPCW